MTGTDSGRPDRQVIPGRVLAGRYRIGDPLGQGGSAVVHRAVDELLGRSVAIKIFRSYTGDLTRPARQRLESFALAGLSHPHLVTVFDAHLHPESELGTDVPSPPDPAFLVMELIDGHALNQELNSGPIPPESVRAIGIAMASALESVHAAGLVHRDIKPGNILIRRDGVAKLSDFGAAHRIGSAGLTSTDGLVGTAAYLSPEQAGGGTVGPPTDIYALGLVLLECLTGRREFPGSPVESAVARLLRDPVVSPDLPAPWSELLTAMTTPDASVRPDAAQVLSTLTDADAPSAAGRPRIATPANGVEGSPNTRRFALPVPSIPEAESAAPLLAIAGLRTTVPPGPPHTTRAADRREQRRRRSRWAMAAGGIATAGAALLIALTGRSDTPPEDAGTTVPPGGVASVDGSSTSPTTATTPLSVAAVAPVAGPRLSTEVAPSPDSAPTTSSAPSTDSPPPAISPPPTETAASIVGVAAGPTATSPTQQAPATTPADAQPENNDNLVVPGDTGQDVAESAREAAAADKAARDAAQAAEKEQRAADKAAEKDQRAADKAAKDGAKKGGPDS